MIYLKLILLIIAILLTGFILFYGYMQLKRIFQLTEKSVAKRIIVLIFCLLFTGLNNYFFNIIKATPIKNNGIEFNSERDKMGIPRIENNWIQRTGSISPFNTHWYQRFSDDGKIMHYKKVIKNGFFGIKYEYDYFNIYNQKGGFAWSKYDYKNKSFEYLLFKNSMNKSIFVNSKGEYEFPTDENGKTEIVKISKAEFETYISE